jgi:hypothetical protein
MAEWACGEADWLDPPGVPRFTSSSLARPTYVRCSRFMPPTTTMSGPILLCPRMHRLFVLFDGTVSSPRGRSSADFIMSTAERSFWQGQASRRVGQSRVALSIVGTAILFRNTATAARETPGGRLSYPRDDCMDCGNCCEVSAIPLKKQLERISSSIPSRERQ